MPVSFLTVQDEKEIVTAVQRYQFGGWKKLFDMGDSNDIYRSDPRGGQ